MPGKEFLAVCFDFNGVIVDHKYRKPLPGIRELIRDLYTEGRHLAIVSGFDEETVKKHLGAEMLRFFRKVYSAAGREKLYCVYDFAEKCGLLETEIDRVAFVDDKPENLAAFSHSPVFVIGFEGSGKYDTAEACEELGIPFAATVGELRNLLGVTVESEEISSLDEMFAASRRYRNSREYMDMLKFISRFPKYSPFNCLLLYTQNPSVSYVATAGTWAKKFGRYPKYDARPLVILAPMSPVLFVYDLKDTEGEPVPSDLIRPFHTEGKLPVELYKTTSTNAALHGIEVREVLLRHHHGGSAVRMTNQARKKYRNLQLGTWAKYLILLGKEHPLEDRFSSLVHELAHIFCGHLGIDETAWWPDRQNEPLEVKEIEAESVAYLVCRRKGLIANSEKYLSAYNAGRASDLPDLSLNAIIQATTYIEEMGQTRWKKPPRASRYQDRDRRR
jgi:uncharacterized small protein (DUF1192 family)